MTEVCTLKEIASALQRSEKTVRRLEKKKIIVLRRTATGHFYCFRSEIKKIVSQYMKCP